MANRNPFLNGRLWGYRESSLPSIIILALDLPIDTFVRVFALKSDAFDLKHGAKVLLFSDIAKEYYARYEN